MATRLTAVIVTVIVGATLVAGLIVGAQRDDNSGPVDLIVYNGKVYTGNGGRFAEAVAVRGSQVLRVGLNREIRRLRRPQTRMIDAGGGAVLAGFNDAHVHFADGGLTLETANLLGAATFELVQETIRGYADAHPDRPWVLGRGWSYAAVPGGLPTRQQLDAIVPNRPAYITSGDGKTGWANSRALALAGITRRTRDPRNGTIVKDRRTGEPTGVLKEAAQELMEKALPMATREQRLRAIRAAVAEANRYGITSIQSAGGDPTDLELYDEIRRTGDLTVRVYGTLAARPGLSEAHADRLDAVWKQYPDDPLLKTGAVELVVDGAVKTHTAAVPIASADKKAAGRTSYSPDELNRVVAMMDRRGWQVLIHAVGDREIRMALNAYAHAASVNPAPARGRRHRIERIESVDADVVVGSDGIGVIASMQPPSPSLIPGQTDVWPDNVGPTRASQTWPWRDLVDAGAHLAFGSDWPAVSMDPRVGLNIAVSRTMPEGEPEGGWLPEQKLSVANVVDAYTSGAAYASFDEQRKGTIASGMLADVVVLSGDIFSLPPDKVLDAVVDVTVLGGKVVYTRSVPPEASTEG